MQNDVVTKSIDKVIIGIRYERNFGIMDESGKIVDIITKSRKSPFDKGFFTNVGEHLLRARTLETADRQSSIRLTTDDLVFQYAITKDFETDYKWVVNSCLPFFFDEILRPYKVSQYMRLGVIFSHKVTSPDFLEDFVSSLTASTISHPESLVVRFSKKIPYELALAKKEINDYRNVIFTVNKENSNLQVDIDIQHYFNPFPEGVEEFNFDYKQFFVDAKDMLLSKYHPLLVEKFLPRKLEAKK